jgi:hypothetical protein
MKHKLAFYLLRYADMKRIIFTATLLLWALLSPVTGFSQTVIWVSPTAATGGIGTAGNPMNLADLGTALASGGALYSTANLEVRFFNGTYNIPAGSGLIATSSLIFPISAVNVKLTSADPSYKPVINAPTEGTAGNNTRRARFCNVTPRAAATTIEINNLEFRNFYAQGSLVNGSLFTMGLVGENTNTTLILDSLIIDNCSNTGEDRDYLIGLTANATSNKSLTLTNSIIRNIPERGRLLESRAASANSKLIVHDNIFENCTTGSYMINIINGTNTIYNNTIRNCTMPSAGRILFASSAKLEFYNNTIHNNSINHVINLASGTASIHDNRIYSNTTTGASYILYFTTGNNSTIYNNSIYGNTIGTAFLYTSNPNNGTATKLAFYKNSVYNNTIGGYLMTLVAASDIYNNTFSGNTLTGGTNTRSIYINNALANSIKLINNTIYHSGGLNFNTNRTSTRIANNIIVNTGTANAIVTGTLTNVTFRANALNVGADIFFRPLKSTDGTIVTASFNTYFNSTLDVSNPAPGRQLHTLNDATFDDGLPWDIHSGVNVTGFIPFADDQRGVKRPDPYAIGSYDGSYFKLRSGMPAYIRYTTPYVPGSADEAIDLERFFEQKIDGVPIEYELLSSTAPNPAMGTISDPPSADGKVIFTLPSTPVEGRVEYIYRVTQGTYSELDSFEVVTVDATHLLDMADDLPGYINPEDVSCFDYMGAVTFSSAYRFQTNVVNGTANNTRMYGYSIPLVGDLNHDGFPEILGVSSTGTGDNQNGSYNGISIYSGQTGIRLAKLIFPGSTATGDGYTTATYHATPSIMALIDSDRDSTIEVIVAFPNGGGSATYRNRVVSFNIEYNEATNTYATDLVNHIKWTSAAAYNDTQGSPYDRPIVHVADLNMDGKPEVVVYNKIYDAQNGTLLATLETLTTAYTGRQSTSNDFGNNSYVSFGYIYDMDGDGAYDIVAGGKVYYKFDFTQANNDDRYKKVEMTGVLDGRTGVADINGDGLPDVVVARRVGATIDLTVWNPDLVRLDGSGKLATNTLPAVPAVLTSRSLPLTDSGSGTNSYVYIGDIDGREQVVDGKIYRLPEIAILSGVFNFATDIVNGGGHHPNVVGTDVAVKIPTTGTSSTAPATGSSGVIAAWTWDAGTLVSAAQRMKLSFILGHADASVNTGFTMFDFDNDGMQEICYRDENTLRIIKASKPYITYTETQETSPDVILFSQSVRSGTGFEYPVIADIDNDASAEMVVMGAPAVETYGYIYALGNGSGDKFAPALPVWNQFMYDPFKINPDLTVAPAGVPAPNRLDPAYNMVREIKNENNVVIKVIENVNPYNGTLIQAPRVDGTALPKFDPIVFMPQAYIRPSSSVTERPEIVEVGTNSYIALTIGNEIGAMSSVSVNTPVAVYMQNTISHETRDATWLLGDLLIAGSATETLSSLTTIIAPGVSYRLWIPIPDPEDVYIVRLGDNSDGSGWRFGYNGGTSSVSPCTSDGFSTAGNTGISSRAFRDCYWCDQTVRAAKYTLFDDAETVQEYGSVSVDFLNNDILPLTFAAGFAPTGGLITMQPKAGTVTVAGTGVNSRIVYHHTGEAELTHSIDSFRYQLTYLNDMASPPVNETKSATVYVYVMRSVTGSFSACFGSQSTVGMVENPMGVSFEWYDVQNGGNQLQSPGLNHTMTGSMTADSIYWLKPQMTLISGEPEDRIGLYQTLNFARGKLTVAMTTHSTGSVTTMRWTGAADRSWFNPSNWEQLGDGGGMARAVLWTPGSDCVDVIIGENCPRYPELTSDVTIHHLYIENRAVIAGINYLTYTGATVYFTPLSSEKNRFVMWSAPLKDMYTGDYHFPKSDLSPDWGLTYMNFFQSSNPDYSGSVAEAKTFTATFGSMGTPLPLGKAFNINILPDTEGKYFEFPRTFASYTGANGSVSGALSRSNSGRLITDGSLAQNGELDLPVDASYSLIQVVNPFPAYLKVNDFLTHENNVDRVESAYKIWSGNMNEDFITVLVRDTMRAVISDELLVPNGTETLIAPFQSFFVTKKGGASFTSLSMTMSMTTTVGPSARYVLRSASEEPGLLRITAKQLTYHNSTALMRKTLAANLSAGSSPSKAFLDGVPVSVYTLSDDGGRALAINLRDNNFDGDVKLGIRVKDTEAPVTLDFSGLGSFGQPVYLIDHEQNDKFIELQQDPTYTFKVKTDNPSVTPTEVNDRFTLQFGDPTRSVSVDNGVIVRSGQSRIDIRSTDGGLITGVEIYNVSGMSVYKSSERGSSITVPVAPNRLYLVKVFIEGKAHPVQKVMVLP